MRRFASHPAEQIAVALLLAVQATCTRASPGSADVAGASAAKASVYCPLSNMPLPGASGARIDRNSDCHETCDQQGDIRSQHLECVCGSRCPTSVAAGIDELGTWCRPSVTEGDDEVFPGVQVVERRDGCGVIELTTANRFTRQSFVFDAQTGVPVGAMFATDRYWFCGPARVAGRVHGRPLCPSAEVCRLCGPEAESDVPACDPALACGIDFTTLRVHERIEYDTLSSYPDSPDAGME